MAEIGAERDEYRLVKVQKMQDDLDNHAPMRANADFVWKIDKLAERADGTRIDSEYCNVRTERYKMRLSCGWRYVDGKFVQIYLRIYPSECDADLKWPFIRRITVTITNQQSPTAHKSVIKNCQITRPPNKYREYQCCAPFTFVYSDLSNAGLLLGNSMVVNCVIHKK